MYSPQQWMPFGQWCKAKGFTAQHGYNLIKRGKLQTLKSGDRRFVSEEQDKAFDEAARLEGAAPTTNPAKKR